MAVEYTTVTGHHAGFGMWQTAPGPWQVFGREYDAESNDGVADAEIADWINWMTSENGCEIERDTDATNEIDGNVYEQNGGEIIIARHANGGGGLQDGDGIVYAVREVSAEEVALDEEDEA